MGELPERFFGIPFKDDESAHWLGQFWSVRCSEDDIELLRADTAIPRAEADAMVAAVVDSCAEVLEECGIDGSAFAQTFEEYRRGRAAFEQAVRGAVEAERERCASLCRLEFEKHMDLSIAASLEGLKKTARQRESAANMAERLEIAIRAPQETSE